MEKTVPDIRIVYQSPSTDNRCYRVVRRITEGVEELTTEKLAGTDSLGKGSWLAVAGSEAEQALRLALSYVLGKLYRKK